VGKYRDTLEIHRPFFVAYFYVGMGKLELEEIELENFLKVSTKKE
jgi:hypothetical protein